MPPRAARRAQADRAPLRLRAAAGRRDQPRHRRAEVVAAVAAEERVLDHLTLTAEPGVIGGMPQGGLDFGAAVNTQALLHQNQQFDFYDGGGLDLACLGMAEIDRARQRQRQPLRPAPGRRRRLHQHQPERAPAGLRRHLHRRRAAGRDRGRARAHRSRRGGSASSSTRSSRSPSAGRWRRARARRCSTSPSAASSRCGRRGCS